MPPTLRKESPTHRTQVVRRGGGGMRKKERARSERARGRERAIDGGSDDSDDTFARGNKQPPLVLPLSFPGLSRFLQSKTPSFRPSYLGRKQAVLAILSLLLLSGL